MRTLLGVLAPLCLFSCDEAPLPSNGEVQGAQIGQAMRQHIPASLSYVAPYRCAQQQSVPPPLPDLYGSTLTLEGDWLSVQTKAKTELKIAVLADSRGATPTTLSKITRLRHQLVSENIQLVISLGGLATEANDIEAILNELTNDTDYVVYALPGDREGYPAHQGAIENISKNNRHIIDGSLFPLLLFQNQPIVGLPGIEMRSNLIAGTEGCLFEEGDVQRIATLLAQRKEPALLASYAPLFGKQPVSGAFALPTATNVTAALATSSLLLSVHALLSAPDSVHKGSIRRTPKSNLSLSAGAIDPLDQGFDALILSIGKKTITWKQLWVAKS